MNATWMGSVDWAILSDSHCFHEKALNDPATGCLEGITGPGVGHRYRYAPGTSLITGIHYRDITDTEALAGEVRRTDLAGRLFGIEASGENDDVLQRHSYFKGTDASA